LSNAEPGASRARLFELGGIMSKRSELLKQRYAEDPEYREGVLAANRARYDNRKDEINAGKRERYATDPEYRQRCLDRDKTKARERELKRKYGLSLQDFDAILTHQGGACAICREKFNKTPHVDHCHATHVVRGLLCDDCNKGLGCFDDDIDIMQAAIDYLERPASSMRCIARPRRKQPVSGAADAETCRLGRAHQGGTPVFAGFARPNTSKPVARSSEPHAQLRKL
jgi:Recombination endonuclease VII